MCIRDRKNPHKKEEPYAVVQLRQDNKSGTLYNIVGFQTKMKHGAQKEIFKTIPGLENSEFARLGGLHRNTFIKSPKLLDPFLRLKSSQNIIFAGQITGVEGYVESSAIGFMAGIVAAYDLKNKKLKTPFLLRLYLEQVLLTYFIVYLAINLSLLR